MRTLRLLSLLPPFALLLSTPVLQAAVSISSPAVPDPFPAIPDVADWSQLSVGTSGPVITAEDFDIKVIAAADASLVTGVLGSSGTYPPSTNAIARFNTGAQNGGVTFLQTRPTGPDYILLMATLVNATNGPLNSVRVAYDYSSASGAGENVEGLRAYWSTTGAPGSWALIPSLSVPTVATYDAPDPVSASITLPAPLADGGTLYVLWADQNSNGGTDASYHIKNFSASPGLAIDCSVAATASNFTRIVNDPIDPLDDIVGFTVNVVPTGAVSASWSITGPGGSAAVGQGGAYNTPVVISNIPVTEFPAGSLAFVVGDTGTPDCSTSVNVKPPRIMATDNHLGTNLPILTVGNLVTSRWVFDDAARSMTMNNGGGGARQVVSSEVVSLVGVGAVEVAGVLEVNDASTGTEDTDSFVAYLVINGNTANPVNLILPHDTLVPDGVLTNDELAPAGGNFPLALSHVIPESANSVQIIVEGINDSGNETFIVRDLVIAPAPPTLQTTPGAVTFNNQGTASAGDDTFSAPVTIEAIMLGASTGWSSDATPASGLYAAAQPVTFGPFPAADAPKTVTLTDNLDNLETSAFTLNLPTRIFTVSAPANIVRNENGAGIADDTVTFEVTVAGTFGGPGWTTPTLGVTPASGNLGTISLTIAAPLPAGPLDVAFEDSSYPASTQTVAVALPPRYVVGLKDLGGGLSDVNSDVALTPPTAWINDPLLRTLTMNVGGAAESAVTSELINLTAAGDVFFTAVLTANDTSTGSNFETADKFKAELVYTVGGVPTTVNLISPFDIGDGAPSTTGPNGGVNGPQDGYLNGYQGTAGTDLENAAVYAAGLDDYDAHTIRDEFNRLQETGATSISNTFSLAATIPAAADNVRLIVTGAGIGGTTETVIVSDVLFSTTGTPGDTDGDGMTDAYEDANGLNKNSPADKFLDKDGDGQSNFDEFVAGTAANSAASVLKVVTVSKTATTATVVWTSVPGKVYRIDIGGGLTTWTDIGVDFPAAAGPATQTSSGALDLTGIGNPPIQFLRVRVKP